MIVILSQMRHPIKLLLFCDYHTGNNLPWIISQTAKRQKINKWLVGFLKWSISWSSKFHQIEARNIKVTVLVCGCIIFQEWHKISNSHTEKSVSSAPRAWLFDNLHQRSGKSPENFCCAEIYLLHSQNSNTNSSKRSIYLEIQNTVWTLQTSQNNKLSTIN